MGATVMTVVTLATSLVPAQAVLAGEASASVDEAMYVLSLIHISEPTRPY